MPKKAPAQTTKSSHQPKSPGPDGTHGGSQEKAQDKGHDEVEAKPFAVVDRRFWAQPPSDEHSDAEPARKPSFVEDLEKRLKEQQDKVSDTLARHQHAVAEFEAARARLRRDMAKEVEGNRRALFVDLLEIVDNLERAITAAEATNDTNTLIDGVKLVRAQFLAKLAEYGVRQNESLGHHFDPAQHAAVSTVPVKDPAQDGVVVGVVKEGYLVGDEVLRPATVAVGAKE